MALNPNNPPNRPDHTKAIVGNQGAQPQQDPGTDKLTHARVDRNEGNVNISGHDLVNDGDFVIPDDVSGLSNPPLIGGANWSVLGVESLDSNNFDITFEYGLLDNNGNFQVRFTYDSTDNAKLDGDNSYIISIRPVRDRIRVTLSDTSGAGQNNIQGGLNSN